MVLPKQPILKMRGGLKARPTGWPKPQSENKDKFLPRSPEIQELCGLYTTEESPLYKAYKASGTKLKFSRWLTNTLGMSEVEVKEAVEESKQIQYRVSGGVKAILRCSITPHFQSCYNPDGCNSHMPYKLLTNSSDFGVVYVADKAGHYTNRFFIGIGTNIYNSTDPTDRYVLFYRPYGELAVCKKIAKDLSRRIKALKRYKVTDSEYLYITGRPGYWPTYTEYTPDPQHGWTR